MEDPERLADLSDSEIATLRYKRKVVLAALLALPTIELLACGVVGILIGDWKFVPETLLVSVPLLFVPSMRGFIRKWSALSTDLRSGQRKIVVNRIESQRQDIRQVGANSNPRLLYTYLLKVKDREVEVSEAQYYQCKAGQLVEIQLAPCSGVVFSIGVLEDAAPPDNPQTVTTQYT